MMAASQPTKRPAPTGHRVCIVRNNFDGVGIADAIAAKRRECPCEKIFLRRAAQLLCQCEKFFVIEIFESGPRIARIAWRAGKDPKNFSNNLTPLTSFYDSAERPSGSVAKAQCHAGPTASLPQQWQRHHRGNSNLAPLQSDHPHRGSMPDTQTPRVPLRGQYKAIWDSGTTPGHDLFNEIGHFLATVPLSHIESEELRGF